MKGIAIILVTSVFLALGANYSYGPVKKTPCETSADCGKKSCCRDTNGNVIPIDRNGPLGIGLRSGFCEKGPGKQGSTCIQKCGCEKGYTCYRPVSGVCCIPMRCYESKWVEEQKEFWRKCFTNPDCHLPPVAPPGSGPNLS